MLGPAESVFLTVIPDPPAKLPPLSATFFFTRFGLILIIVYPLQRMVAQSALLYGDLLQVTFHVSLPNDDAGWHAR